MKKVGLRPCFHSVALPPVGILEAIPKDVSRRTSYHGVRLEFLPYPQLIHQFCTAGWFGPPVVFLQHSAWPWVAHTVSGTFAATDGLLILAFTMAPSQRDLTEQQSNDSLAHSSIGTPSPGISLTRAWAPTPCKLMVSETISSPFRAAFHLSLAVLVHYRSILVFRLGT